MAAQKAAGRHANLALCPTHGGLTRLAGDFANSIRCYSDPYLDPPTEFFDRAAVPPQIQELLDEWPEIDPGTARLIRAAVMSYDPRQWRQAWELLNARAVRPNRKGHY